MGPVISVIENLIDYIPAKLDTYFEIKTVISELFW